MFKIYNENKMFSCWKRIDTTVIFDQILQQLIHHLRNHNGFLQRYLALPYVFSVTTILWIVFAAWLFFVNHVKFSFTLFTKSQNNSNFCSFQGSLSLFMNCKINLDF